MNNPPTHPRYLPLISTSLNTLPGSGMGPLNSTVLVALASSLFISFFGEVGGWVGGWVGGS